MADGNIRIPDRSGKVVKNNYQRIIHNNQASPRFTLSKPNGSSLELTRLSLSLSRQLYRLVNIVNNRIGHTLIGSLAEKSL